jgi:hypothetical protein
VRRAAQVLLSVRAVDPDCAAPFVAAVANDPASAVTSSDDPHPAHQHRLG